MITLISKNCVYSCLYINLTCFYGGFQQQLFATGQWDLNIVGKGVQLPVHL